MAQQGSGVQRVPALSLPAGITAQHSAQAQLPDHLLQPALLPTVCRSNVLQPQLYGLQALANINTVR